MLLTTIVKYGKSSYTKQVLSFFPLHIKHLYLNLSCTFSEKDMKLHSGKLEIFRSCLLAQYVFFVFFLTCSQGLSRIISYNKNCLYSPAISQKWTHKIPKTVVFVHLSFFGISVVIVSLQYINCCGPTFRVNKECTQ